MWASNLSLLWVFVNIISIQVFVLFILSTLSIIHLRGAPERYKRHKTNSVSGDKLNTKTFVYKSDIDFSRELFRLF